VAASALTSAVAPGDYGAIGKEIMNPISGIIQSGIQYGADKLFGNQASWNFGNVATDAFGNALGNFIVSGLSSKPTSTNSAQPKAKQNGASSLDPDTGKFSPITDPDAWSLDKALERLRESDAKVEVGVLERLPAFEETITTPSRTKGWVNEDLIGYSLNQYFNENHSLSYSPVTTGYLPSGGQPQSKGFWGTAWDYVSNGGKVIGGVTKFFGDTISGAAERIWNNPVESLYSLNNGLRVAADALYAGTVDVFARPFGFGNGAWERTSTRFDSFVSGTLAGINSYENSIYHNYSTRDYVGVGENIGAALMFASPAWTGRAGGITGTGITKLDLSFNGTPVRTFSGNNGTYLGDFEAGGTRNINYDLLAPTAKKHQSTVPRDYFEELVIQQVKANPSIGEPLLLSGDARFPVSHGWQKTEYVHRLPDNQNITIHYQYNVNDNKAYDVKVTSPKTTPQPQHEWWNIKR
uniref:hypothetical protein n=1 Tax=Pseudoalteromonas sp. TaxID=53249 RepID=UPI00235237AC